MEKIDLYRRLLLDIFGSDTKIRRGRDDDLMKEVDEVLQYAGEPHYDYHDRRQHIYMLRARYGLDNSRRKTLAAIGIDYGVSHQRVSKVIQDTLLRLRHHVYSARLKVWIY